MSEFISSLTRADILQIVQIVCGLALAAVSALVWYYDIWRRNFPLSLRLRDMNGVTFRRVRLAPGVHPHTAHIVSLSRVRITTTNGPTLAVAGPGVRGDGSG